jgi:O-antigen/teichoic acid export membrane protein
MRSWSLRKILRDLTPREFEGLWIRLESLPAGERLLRGAFWTMVGSVVSRAMGLAAAILAARVVGRMVYGQLGIIQSTVGMLGTLAGFGMSTTATKYVAELRQKDPVRAGRIIALCSLSSWMLSLALAIALLCLAPWLCEHTLAAPQLTGYLRTSAPLLVLAGINGAQLGVLFGFEAFRSVARVNSITGLVNFPLIVGGALLFGLTGIILGMILAQAVGCLLNWRALRLEAGRNGVRISYSSCLTDLPIVWHFSIPSVLTQVLISAVGWATATLLVRQPNGYSEMGAFNAANQWFNAALWLPMMIGNAALPVLSERFGAADDHNSVKLLSMSVKINGLMLLPVVALGCFASPYIMMSYGAGFKGTWPTLVAVLITAGLVGLELPIGEFLSACGRVWVGFWSNLGWGIIFISSCVWLLKWGAVGLASARMLAYLLHAVFILIYVIIFFISRRRATIRKTNVPAIPDVVTDRVSPMSEG